MTERELEDLKRLGCEVDYDPMFLADEGYFECLYVISYKDIFVGSDLCTYEQVRNNMKKVEDK